MSMNELIYKSVTNIKIDKYIIVHLFEIFIVNLFEKLFWTKNVIWITDQLLFSFSRYGR